MKQFFLAIFGLLLLCNLQASTLEVPSIFANGMIMQQNSSVKVWGWASSEDEVKISSSWTKGELKASTGKNGEWVIKLSTPAFKQGETHNLTIKSIKADTTIVISDILFGEVWMCSGQSNMKRHMATIFKAYPGEGPKIIREADGYKDKIRFFTIEDKIASEPQKDVPGGKWVKVSSESLRGLAAIPYFFASSMWEGLQMPIAIIWNAWGGSNIEAWMDKPTLSQVDRLYNAPKSPRIREQNVHHGIYNSKFYPLKDYAIKGFTWYQGESNISETSVPADYRLAFRLMVNSWRELWGDENLPFYYIQIAPYKYSASENTELPRFVETQVVSLSDLKNVGIVPTGDVGNEATVHPLQKKEVGERLALLALNRTYGIVNDALLPSEGSMVDKISFSGGKATVILKRFGAKHKDGDEIIGFTLSGDDKTFYPATAVVRFKPTRIEVSCSEVKKPVALRYAFKNFYTDANLFDDYGMPSFPFRTDDWDEVK